MYTIRLHAIGRSIVTLKGADVDALARQVVEWQDTYGLGSSDLAIGHGTIQLDRRNVGRVSYNGRVWWTP